MRIRFASFLAVLRIAPFSCIVASIGAPTAVGQAIEPEPIYRWTTLAGRASIGAEDGPRTAARFNHPHGVARDQYGNIYVADTGNHTVRQISRAGMVVTFAGTAGKAGHADGSGDAARFTSPTGITIDPAGNIYVTDAGNYVVRKITPAGVVSTVAGQVGKKGHADGPPSAALFGDLDQIAADAKGNVYVMDHGLRRIAGSAVETLHAFTGGTVFYNPHGSVAVDSSGQVFFVLPGGDGILKRSTAGVTSTAVNTDPVGSPPLLFPSNQSWVGPLTVDAFDTLHFAAHYFSTAHDYYGMQLSLTEELHSSGLNFTATSGLPELPLGLAVDIDGGIIYTRASDDAILQYKADDSGKSVFAGTAWSNFPIPGAGQTVRFSDISALAVDRDGQVVVADCSLWFRPGGGFFGGASLCRVTATGEVTLMSIGPLYERPPNRPTGVAVDNANNAMLASSDWLSRLQLISPGGGITSVPGSDFRSVVGVAYDATGQLLVIDSRRRVHRRNLSGEWSVLAGADQPAEIKDGQGDAARFGDLQSITASGNDAYVLDNLYVDGRVSHSCIRKIQPDGTVTTTSGDLVKPTGEAPAKLALTPKGRFVLTYPLSHVVTLLATTGNEIVIGGSAGQTGSRDGLGSNTRFYGPDSVSVDIHNNIFIADALGTTIRKGELLGYKPALTTQPQSQSVAAGSSATFSVTVAPETTAPIYQWQFNGTAIAGATSASITIAPAGVTNAGDYTVIVTNDLGSATSNKATLTVTGAPPPLGGSGAGGGGGGPSHWFAALAAITLLLRAQRPLIRCLSSGRATIDCLPEQRRWATRLMHFSAATSFCALLCLLCATLGLPRSALAADYYFTHLAGPLGGPGNADGAAATARFNTPSALAFDSQGNLFVLDAGNRTIRKITPQGAVSTIRPDGQTAIWFAGEAGLAIDASGTLYVSDATHTIFKITPESAKAAWAGRDYYPTYEGHREIGRHSDGPVSSALFFRPSGMAVDRVGNLYVADTGNHVIRKITPDGLVSTIAGTPRQSGTVDGAGATARFVGPRSIAVDAAGVVYVADVGSIRKIAPDGTVTTVAGIADQTGSADGIGAAARFSRPAIALDASGYILVADSGNHTIRRVSPTGEVTTIVGVAGQVGRVDGAGTQARFTNPLAIAVASDGAIVVADSETDTIRRIGSDGVVTTFAGVMGGTGKNDAIGSEASFDQLWGIAIDASGNMFVADQRNRALRGISPAGAVTSLPGYFGSSMQGISAIAMDLSGRLVAAPAAQDIVVKVAPDGALFDMAGEPVTQVSTSTVGAFRRYTYLIGAAVHPITGATYLADGSNHTIWIFSPTGQLSQLALKSAEIPLDAPNGLAFDLAGNLYVADRTQCVIEKITPNGTLTILAGKPGEWGYADGVGSAARFGGPTGVAVDASGNVFVADNGTSTIRKITPEGVVTTLGGKWGTYGSVDGIGANAHFFGPHAIAIGQDGTLYIAEEGNSAVRKGQLTAVPAITLQPRSQTAVRGSSVTFSVTADAVPVATYQWYVNDLAFAGATSATLTLNNLRPEDAGDYSVVVTNSLGSITSAKATLTVASAPPPPSGGGSSSGGGGAPSVWFAVAIAALATIRRFRRAGIPRSRPPIADSLAPTVVLAGRFS